MLFTKFKSTKTKNVNISHYLINWSIAPSKEQQRLQDFLYPYWKNHIVLAEFLLPGSLLRFDIINISQHIIVEHSPNSTHGEFNKFFHVTRSGYLKRIKNDMAKIEWAENQNPPFRVIETTEEDLDLLSRKYFLEKFNVLL